MSKKAHLFDFKKQPAWLNKFLTIIFLIFALTLFIMAGFGLWNKLLITSAVLIIIIMLTYAAYYFLF